MPSIAELPGQIGAAEILPKPRADDISVDVRASDPAANGQIAPCIARRPAEARIIAQAGGETELRLDSVRPEAVRKCLNERPLSGSLFSSRNGVYGAYSVEKLPETRPEAPIEQHRCCIR